MVNKNLLTLSKILSVAGIIFLFIGAVGFGCVAVLGISKILNWWQSVSFIVIFLILILIGLLSFKRGENYKKLAKKK